MSRFQWLFNRSFKLSRGNPVTAANLRTLLAFTSTNLQAHAESRVTASATDKSRASNTILSTADAIPMPTFSGPTGSEVTAASIATYVNLLARTVALRTFQFSQTGCGTSYTRVSATISRPAQTHPSPAGTGLELTQVALTNANASLRAQIDANRTTLQQSFSYCHCSCHSSCHGSRGRR